MPGKHLLLSNMPISKTYKKYYIHETEAKHMFLPKEFPPSSNQSSQHSDAVKQHYHLKALTQGQSIQLQHTQKDHVLSKLMGFAGRWHPCLPSATRYSTQQFARQTQTGIHFRKRRLKFPCYIIMYIQKVSICHSIFSNI